MPSERQPMPSTDILTDDNTRAGFSVATKTSLAGLDRERLGAALRAAGVPEQQLRMRHAQLWSWIYARGASSFDAMSDVSKELRRTLAQSFTLRRPAIVKEQISTDGTRKWLLRLEQRQHDKVAPEIETVYIPEVARGTLCISSQVGCTLSCSFCHTGTQRLVRNLEASEIVGQILLARDRVGDWPGAVRDGAPLPEGERKITNVVLMGMGEPLYNFDNVKAAMTVAADGAGLAFSKRRITLSTSGVVPEIPRWGAEAGTMLAISLHAVRDALRDRLVPINRKYPIATLLEACVRYLERAPRNFVTFEYVMLDGVNDSPDQARALAARVRDVPCKVNLIPWNPFPGADFRTSPRARILAFQGTLADAGLVATIRRTRGDGIDAACGQLVGRVRDRTKRTIRIRTARTAPATH